MALFRPFLSYNSEQNFIYPGVVAEDYREPRTVDRRDHVAGNYTISYLVGKQDFIEVRFPWQSDALITQWNAWWASVMDGSPFYYYTLDDIPICGDGTICGDGSFCGFTGVYTNVATLVKVDMLEFAPEREEVYGFWSVAIRMRKIV